MILDLEWLNVDTCLVLLDIVNDTLDNGISNMVDMPTSVKIQASNGVSGKQNNKFTCKVSKTIY